MGLLSQGVLGGVVERKGGLVSRVVERLSGYLGSVPSFSHEGAMTLDG